MGMPELEIYSMIGAEGFARLVAAFYRQVPQDDLLGPIYPASDLPGAEQRLRDFLIGRFGGPQTYIEQRGHPRLRARHSPFAINQTIRDRWMRLMKNALGEASLPRKAEEVLRKFFNEMSTFMINQSEPGSASAKRLPLRRFWYSDSRRLLIVCSSSQRRVSKLDQRAS